MQLFFTSFWCTKIRHWTIVVIKSSGTHKQSMSPIVKIEIAIWKIIGDSEIDCNFTIFLAIFPLVRNLDSIYQNAHGSQKSRQNKLIFINILLKSYILYHLEDFLGGFHDRFIFAIRSRKDDRWLRLLIKRSAIAHALHISWSSSHIVGQKTGQGLPWSPTKPFNEIFFELFLNIWYNLKAFKNIELMSGVLKYQYPQYFQAAHQVKIGWTMQGSTLLLFWAIDTFTACYAMLPGRAPQ